MPKIIKLQINKVKGEAPIAVESLYAEKNQGIRGDRHQSMEGRDVCICRKELLDWMEQQEVKGLCFSRHKENLLIEGFRAEELIPGAILSGNEAVLSISDFPKHCFPEQCPLAQSGTECLLKREWQMAKIEQSGSIHTGETLTLR